MSRRSRKLRSSVLVFALLMAAATVCVYLTIRGFEASYSRRSQESRKHVDELHRKVDSVLESIAEKYQGRLKDRGIETTFEPQSSQAIGAKKRVFWSAFSLQRPGETVASCSVVGVYEIRWFPFFEDVSPLHVVLEHSPGHEDFEGFVLSALNEAGLRFEYEN